ncbi:PKD domain-containing protein [Candidatus Peregrinibacteria bacterium]|nr:PKD domain-containing protein [Candidatus Peregrinibacteria bacterium]
MKKSVKIITGLIGFLAIANVALAYSGDIGIDKKDITFSSDTFIEGKSVRIYATATNSSSQDLLGVVRFYDDNKEIGSDQPISIFAGKNDGVFIDWIPTSGEHTIQVKLYPWHPEIDDPGNNTISTTVNVTQDSDHDGIPNPEEIKLGTDPQKADSDGDGLSDSQEIYTYHTDPLKADTDGDGLADGNEINLHHTDPLKADTDGDKLSDGDEVNIYHTDPLKIDTDGDTLTDGDEINIYHTDPLKADTDGDGISDSDEIKIHNTDPTKTDTDNDGLADSQEIRLGTNPLNPDTDDDGIPDGVDPAPLNKAPVISISTDNTQSQNPNPDPNSNSTLQTNITSSSTNSTTNSPSTPQTLTTSSTSRKTFDAPNSDSKIVNLLSTQTFDATPSFDPDGKIINYQWEVDGKKVQEGNKKTLTQTFTTLGKHPVKLTITDNNGQSVSKEYEVSVVNIDLYKEIGITIATILLALVIYFKYIRSKARASDSELKNAADKSHRT